MAIDLRNANQAAASIKYRLANSTQLCLKQSIQENPLNKWVKELRIETHCESVGLDKLVSANVQAVHVLVAPLQPSAGRTMVKSAMPENFLTTDRDDTIFRWLNVSQCNVAVLKCHWKALFDRQRIVCDAILEYGAAYHTTKERNGYIDFLRSQNELFCDSLRTIIKNMSWLKRTEVDTAFQKAVDAVSSVYCFAECLIRNLDQFEEPLDPSTSIQSKRQFVEDKKALEAVMKQVCQLEDVRVAIPLARARIYDTNDD